LIKFGCKSALDVQKRGGSGIMATLVDVDLWKEEKPELFFKPGEERLEALSNYER
jgi:hypothetical protein